MSIRVCSRSRPRAARPRPRYPPRRCLRAQAARLLLHPLHRQRARRCRAPACSPRSSWFCQLPPKRPPVVADLRVSSSARSSRCSCRRRSPTGRKPAWRSSPELLAGEVAQERHGLPPAAAGGGFLADGGADRRELEHARRPIRTPCAPADADDARRAQQRGLLLQPAERQVAGVVERLRQHRIWTARRRLPVPESGMYCHPTW